MIEKRIERRNEVVKFLQNNGWTEDMSDYEHFFDYENEDTRTMGKKDNIGVDILLDEVVLIGESGDFEHIEINRWIIYTLIGFLLNHRYISIDYVKEN